jgi:hypothetical protein
MYLLVKILLSLFIWPYFITVSLSRTMQAFLLKASWLFSVNTIYFENKIFGLLPFKYNNKLKVFETCRFSLFYCVCVDLFLLVCIPVGIFKIFVKNSELNIGLVVIFTFFGNLVLTYIMTVIAFTSYLPNHSEIVNIMNECCRLFRLLSEKKEVNNSKYTRKFMVKFTFKIFIMFMMLYSSLDAIQQSPFFYFLQQSQMMVFFLVNFNFFIFMLLVKYLLDNLSIKLAHFIKNHQSDRKQLEPSMKNAKMTVDLTMCESLEEIVVFYERIGKITDQFNRIYSVQLLFIFGMIFYNLVANVSRILLLEHILL